MSKMTILKITIVVIFLGVMTMWLNNAGAFDKPLPPPQEIPPAKTQMLVDVIMPAHAEAEQTDIDLHKRDPEAYANRFNRNNALYNRSITLVWENGVQAGDTVQLKYFNQYDPPQKTYWELVSTNEPFYESTESGQYSYTEYVKGIVRVVAN